MNMNQFIEVHGVEMSDALIDLNTLKAAEEATNVKFGNELTAYLLRYGYLGFGHIELYGMNSRQGMDSDMVKQTIYLHHYYPQTSGLIAVENQGEGDYYLVDQEDKVLNFDSETGMINAVGLTLSEYIYMRFQSVADTAF